MKKKKVVISVIAIVATILIIGGATYAYWQLTKTQQDSNDIVAACLSLDLENEIQNYSLENAWPMKDEEAISSLTGYTFTVTNNCDYDILYEIGFDSLSMNDVTYLNTNYLKVRLDEKNPGIYGKLNDVTDIDRPNARASKVLGGTTVEAGGSNTHNVKVWLDFNAPTSEINTYFKGLVFITAGQKTTEINDRILIASGDISRTISCERGTHSFDECTPESGNNVRYEFYDNGDFIISGTGDPKADYFYDDGYIEARPLILTIYNDILKEKLTDAEKELLDEGWLDELGSLLNIYDNCMIDSNSNPEACSIISTYNGKYDPELWKMIIETDDTELVNNLISLMQKAESISIKNVIVEEGITSISENMFERVNINSLSLPNSLRKVKSKAFEMANLGNGNLIFPSSITDFDGNDHVPWSNEPHGNVLEFKAPLSDINLGGVDFRIIKFNPESTFTSLWARLDDNGIPLDIYIPESVNRVSFEAHEDKIALINLKFYGPERELEACPTNVNSITWNAENEE